MFLISSKSEEELSADHCRPRMARTLVQVDGIASVSLDLKQEEVESQRGSRR